MSMMDIEGNLSPEEITRHVFTPKAYLERQRKKRRKIIGWVLIDAMILTLIVIAIVRSL